MLYTVIRSFRLADNSNFTEFAEYIQRAISSLSSAIN